MSVVAAKALNSTIGKDNFKAFDVLLSGHVDSIVESIENSAEKSINKLNSIKKISSVPKVTDDKKYFLIGGEYGDKFSAYMPCDGSFFVTSIEGKNRTINIYINGNLKHEKVRLVNVFFSSGDKVDVVVNNEYEQPSEGYSEYCIYAEVY